MHGDCEKMKLKWRRHGEEVQVQAAILLEFFVTAMRLITTISSVMHCHQLKIHRWLIGGSVMYFIPFWSSKRLMIFWFYATLSTVGYVRRECLRYWSFVGSWRGNLSTIYRLKNGRGGLSSFQTPSISWWLHQGTQEDIITGGGFALEKLPINSTYVALNAGKI